MIEKHRANSTLKYLRNLRNKILVFLYYRSSIEKLNKFSRIWIGRPAWIFGSAPNPIPIQNFVDEEYLFVCVNGSYLSARNLVKKLPHLTILNSDITTKKKPANLDVKPYLEEIFSKETIFLEDNFIFNIRSSQITNRSLGRQIYLKKANRDVIIKSILGNSFNKGEVDKISTGMFAIVLSCYFGCRPIFVSGFSLTQDGHAYNQNQRVRSHKEADKAALGRLSQLGYDIRILQ